MPEVNCTRCGQKKEAAANTMYANTPIGQQIASRICVDCWKEWEDQQLRIINEMRLTPVLREHRQYLITQMKAFLGLER